MSDKRKFAIESERGLLALTYFIKGEHFALYSPQG